MNKKFYFWGIIFIFLAGTLFHFLYELSGNNIIIGLISATNESVFSHTKLVLFPTIFWYLIYYKFDNLNKDKYYTSMIYHITTSIISMILLYYTLSCGFRIDNLVSNIILFLVTIICGFLIQHHYYSYSNKILPYRSILAIIILICFIFTIKPLNYPFFIPKK